MKLTPKQKTTIKYSVIGVFILLIITLIVVFFTSVQKDVTLEVTKARLEAQETLRKELVKEREYWERMADKHQDSAIKLQQIDSLLKRRQTIIRQSIPQIKKEHSEKINAINSYRSDELYEYFSNLK